MKELFGIDVTTVKKNDQLDCVSYETKKIGAELDAKLDVHIENAQELEDKAALPAWLGIIRWICAVGGGCLIIAILRNIGKLTLKQMFNNAPWVFIICGTMALAWLGITAYYYVNKRNVESSGEIEETVKEAETINAELRRELGIPENADRIDALLYAYKRKDDEIKIVERMTGHFIRCDAYVFVENGCFCISDGAVRFDIPLGDIHGIDIINKRFYMNEWAKEQSFGDEIYRDFVYERADNLGRVWLRSICVMRFRLQGEEFNFRFPTYELETIESLTGIRGA